MWGKRGYGQHTPIQSSSHDRATIFLSRHPTSTDAPAQGPKPPTYAPTPCIADHPPYQYTTGCVTRFPCPQSIPPTGNHSRPPKLSGPAGSARDHYSPWTASTLQTSSDVMSAPTAARIERLSADQKNAAARKENGIFFFFRSRMQYNLIKGTVQLVAAKSRQALMSWRHRRRRPRRA